MFIFLTFILALFFAGLIGLTVGFLYNGKFDVQTTEKIIKFSLYDIVGCLCLFFIFKNFIL